MKTIVGGLTFLILVVTAEDVAIAQRNRSPEQLARQVFQLRDTNGDRRLSRREFPITHSFDEVDTNKDGSVTLNEEISFRRARLKRAFEQRRQIQAPLPEGAVAHRDLVYAKIGEREMPLDIYLPNLMIRCRW